MQSTSRCTCGKHLDANAQKPGDRGQCPACGNVFVIGERVNSSKRTHHFLFFGFLLGVPLAVVAFIGFFLETPHIDVVGLARAQINGPLTNACESFRVKNGRWPKELKELMDRNDKGGPHLENPDALIDPWGSMYQYDAMGPMNNGARPDVWTVSPKTGAKIGNWPTR